MDMAATKLIAMHVNKGKTISQCLKARVDYAKDEEKTEDERYVTAYACNADIADKEFNQAKLEYLKNTGRQYRGDIIAYQIRQSFKPGEITPEEANRVGYETAMRFTKGEHAFICCTHTDKKHIHNHVIFNAVNLHCDKKFRDSWFCGIGLRRLSDMICLEHGLSVIEPYKFKSLRPKYSKTYRADVRDSIDKAMAQDPKSMDSLLQLLMKEGYEVRRGKHLALRSGDRKNFVSFKSLGKKYSVEALSARMSGESRPSINDTDVKFDLLINIQEKIKQGKGKGYIRWSQKFNNKAMMNTLLFLNEKGIRSYEQLKEMAKAASSDFSSLSENLKKIESRIDELTSLRKSIRDFARTKGVYDEYKKKGCSQKFFEAHREDITVFRAAKKALDAYGKKLPKTKELTNEIEDLMAEKKKYYREYKATRDNSRSLQEAKRNVEMFLQLDTQERTPKKDRGTPFR